MTKLTAPQMGLLKLIGRTPVGPDGWRVVSEMFCSLFTREDFPSSTTPAALFEFEKLEKGGRVKLTSEGEVLLAYS